jgi:hypothetical protein
MNYDGDPVEGHPVFARVAAYMSRNDRQFPCPKCGGWQTTTEEKAKAGQVCEGCR